MKKTWASAVVLILIGAVGYIWFGLYDISARTPHWRVTYEVLEIVKDRSIAAHSKSVKVPSLEKPHLAETGLLHFHAMCRLCHGAPGFRREEFADGLYPSPPPLTDSHLLEEMDDAEIYWVIANGLKMTGMPSFAVTHTEDQLWGIVAFIRQMPNLDAEKYRKLLPAQKTGKPHGDHGQDGDHH